MRRFILLFIIALVPHIVSAQVYAMRDSVSNGYDFWLYVPSNYSDNRAERLAAADSVEVAKPLPVIVFLHGRSLSGTNINKVREYGTIDAVWRGRQIDAFVIAPQVNYNDWWRPERVMNVVEWVSQRYDVDLTRLYVLGMSLGGYGTLDFAATYPDRTAAAVALCGGSIKRGSALHNLNQVPLWIMHGTADAAVAVSESRRVRDGMKEGDASLPRLRYDEQVGANHSVYARVFYIEEIYTWLLKHSTTDPGRPVDLSVQIPYSRYSTSKSAYAGLPRGGGKVQIIDPPTTSNTKGRYLDASGAPAPSPVPETTPAAQQEPAASQTQTTATPAKNTASTSGAVSYQYHTITNGDTLGHIAQKYGTTVKRLCELNGMQKTDILKLGRKLKVGVVGNTTHTSGSAGSQAQYHTIVSGDTLGALAIKYKTTVKKICQLNGITETTILKLGKKLRVK